VATKYLRDSGSVERNGGGRQKLAIDDYGLGNGAFTFSGAHACLHDPGRPRKTGIVRRRRGDLQKMLAVSFRDVFGRVHDETAADADHSFGSRGSLSVRLKGRSIVAPHEDGVSSPR
jgi:hypothetical protein